MEEIIVATAVVLFLIAIVFCAEAYYRDKAKKEFNAIMDEIEREILKDKQYLKGREQEPEELED